jgi:hypothetical protein
MKESFNDKTSIIHVNASLKGVSQFLSLLYITSGATSDSYNKELVKTAKLFGMDISPTPHQTNVAGNTCQQYLMTFDFAIRGLYGAVYILASFPKFF